MLGRFINPFDVVSAEFRRLILRAAGGDPRAMVIVLGSLAVILAIFFLLIRVKTPP
jgi:hypothetical protein